MPTSATRVFFDTNVLIYLLSGTAEKAQRAEDLLTAGGNISVQVLNEFTAVARRKLGIAWPDVRKMLQVFRAICVVEPLDVPLHDRALALAERYGYSIYDSCILAAALARNCTILFSEDMQHGQVIDGVLRIQNPFT